ncbi:MAG: hypothetical protein KKB37_06115 [Alphaproteobacteria bacterium]|nr:hypothetical protein [Alphaproteobacteria bacterium]
MPADRSYRLVRLPFVVIALAFGALAVFHVIDVDERQRIIQLAATDVRAAGRRITANALKAPACEPARQGDDLSRLAEAVTIVETFASPRLERALEFLLVRTALLLWLPPPDFSIGPAQIRPSRAFEAARTGNAPSAASDSDKSAAAIAVDLLDRCSARRWARLVLRAYASASDARPGPLGRDEVVRLAAAYNGQRTTADDEAAVANYLYRELVYQVWQDLRFRHANS